MNGEAGDATVGHAPGLSHDALLYGSPADLIAAAVPFLLAGVAAGDATVVAAGPAATTALQAALTDTSPTARPNTGRNTPPDPSGVLFVDRDDLYCPRTPAALAAFRGLTGRLGGGRRVRLVGETDFGDTVEQHLEGQRFEAVLNHALAEAPLSLLCLFDTRRLPEHLLDAARHTHPGLTGPTGRRLNPAAIAPAAYLSALPTPREPLEQTPPRLAVDDIEDFIGLRHQVRAQLSATGGPAEPIEDFLLAVDEMTSNALRHGRPPVALRLWTSATAVVCAITDTGTDWRDPYAGYGPAHGNDLSRGGMGLWLARQLCDHVAITHTPRSVTVRLTTRWAAPADTGPAASGQRRPRVPPADPPPSRPKAAGEDAAPAG